MRSATRDAISKAATEAVWACRLCYARLRTPVDPPAIAAFSPAGGPGQPWTFDYYFHVLSAMRLKEAADYLLEALRDDDELRGAVAVFDERWEHLHPLRRILLHPLNKEFDLSCLYPFFDRLEYRRKGHDPDWVFTPDELHQPVEQLYAAVQAAFAGAA